MRLIGGDNDFCHDADLQLPLWPHEPFWVTVCPGYDYHSERAMLARWGFECCRSRRRNDGTFAEYWVLDTTRAARGELQQALERGLDPKTFLASRLRNGHITP